MAKRGNGNSLTAILQRMTGNKVKITVRKLETLVKRKKMKAHIMTHSREEKAC